MKAPGSTWELHSILLGLSVVEGSGIPGVAVKCVDIGRNISGEGGFLDLAGASSVGNVITGAVLAPRFSSPLKVLYNPKAFFTHAALLDQAFAHCPIFPTAASRRSLGRVSVPVWLIVLSDQLPIVALVSLYLTNKLIGRGLIQ